VAADSGFATTLYDSTQVSNTTSSWAIPSGPALTDGTTYYWRVRAADAYGWSAWSTSQFRWDASGPSLSVADNCATIGGCYRSGNTIYYGPAAAKTITLTATASDAQSGLASICFGSLSAGAGWTYANGCQATSPMNEPIGWSLTAGQTSLPVTAVNTAGGAAGTTTVTLTFVPTQSNQLGADFTTPNEGATTPLVAGTPYSVAWSESDTGGPGIASRSLQRTFAPMSEPGVCPAGTYNNDGTASTTPPPVSQTGLQMGYCYRWLLTLTDFTGTTATFSSGLLIRDPSSAFGEQGQMSMESWDLGGGDQASVNVASGNLVVSHSLVSLPIRGSSVSLGLVYNSQDSANVGLGTGWRLNVQRRLTQNADGSVTFIDSDGARYLFTSPVTNGTVTTYTRPVALFATLVQDTSKPDQFTLTYKDLSADQFVTFGSDGLLARQQDRFGNGVTIAYNAGTEDIATLTDDVGRAINFAWNTTSSPHQLSSITDWAWINDSGVVQTTATGSRRTYRFFYDGTGALIGWSDPLNTGGSCPTNASHLTCLSYTGGQLSQLNGVSKTQTYTTYANSALGSATQVDTTSVVYTTGDVTSVSDALSHQATFDRSTAGQTIAHRPASSAVTYLFSANDPYARVT
jgi:hypothetical protein